MTINRLQEQLIKEVMKLAEELSFVDEKKQEAKLKGYQQAIPVLPAFRPIACEEEQEIEFEIFPYCIVRVSDVRYSESNPKACVAMVFGIHDDDPEMRGYYTLLALIEKVIIRFRTNIIMGPFYCDKDMEVAFQEDDTFPYFYGGIEMKWNLPDLEMEAIECRQWST